jgi:pyruvate-formate lyase-activating enzyme
MGQWINTDVLAKLAQDYFSYVTFIEPRSRATMWHAEDLCLHCGSCIIHGVRSKLCPNKLTPAQIVLSPQGLGPARNIIAFTGGDLTCQPNYYAEAATKIKEMTDNKMLVLIESNGYALTRKNLEILRDGGVDSYWLDIKAFDEKSYKKLCGTSNSTVISSLEIIVELGFTVEVLTLYIPGIVETSQHQQIARLIYNIDSAIPTTLLAFFPSYKLKDLRSPTFNEMMSSYSSMKSEGLKNIRLGNIGVFAKTEDQKENVITLRSNDG